MKKSGDFKNPDWVKLSHMNQAINDICSFMKNKDCASLKKDRQLVLAVTKAIEIIGEAAHRISPWFQQQHSEIPWKELISTRNRLIHGYFDIDVEILWNTIQHDLPPLKKTIQRILD